MANKPLNISESAAVQMPMKTVASLILLVAAGVFAYTELTSRLVSLETSRELFENDLLKKSEQVPTDQEQFMLLEHLAGQIESLQSEMQGMRNNTVNLKRAMTDIEKILETIEAMKDKIRNNGNP
mgnify:CR=1 FL=1